MSSLSPHIEATSTTARVPDPAASFLGKMTMTRPAQIDFGPGTVRNVGAWAASRGLGRSLVVSDAYNARRIDLLALPGVVTVFADVKPEPDVPNLDLLLETARQSRPDLIVGFGGGSAMDIAKLCAVLVQSNKTVRDIVGLNKADARTVALAQVPTTAGTGSEAGTRALVTDPTTTSKISVESLNMLADLAVIDPELTMSVPPAVTAATGIDALAHCVEAFTSKRAHPAVDLFAREGIALVGRYLSRAVKDGADVEARSGLALASLYGGYCLGPVNTTAGHAVSYPLGTRHSIPHGLANAVIFPHVFAFNAPARPLQTQLIADLLQFDRGNLLASAAGFCRSLGIEMRLSALGVPRADLPAMADEAFAIRRLLDFNPRDISAAEILSIYETAY